MNDLQTALGLEDGESPIQAKLADGTLEQLPAEERTQLAREQLRERYSRKDGWFLFEEVGGDDRRRIDAVALSAWPSRGYEVHGFEIKATRSDWLNERDDPRKSKWWMQRVDRWWLVAPTHVAEKDELPKNWGWLRLQNDGSLRQVVAAPELDEGIDRKLLGTLARQLDDAWDDRPAEAELTEAYEDGYQKGKKAGKFEGSEYAVRRLKERRDQLQALVDRFEDEVGVSLSKFNSELDEDTMRAIKAVKTADTMAPKAAHEVKVLASRFNERADKLRELVDGIPGADDVDDEPDGLLMLGGGI